MARHVLFIKLSCRRNSPAVPQFNLLIVLFAHALSKSLQNPILLSKFFRGSERIKSVAMVRQCSRRAYKCALENFTSCGKFWENCKILEASCQIGRLSRFAIRVIFVWSDSMVRKVAFFYNVAFCDLSYNKSRNRAWKILEAPHNYFQLLVLAVGYMKNLAASVFSDLTFPAFPSFFQISKIFQLMVQLFQPPQLLQLQLFQLFGVGPHVSPQVRPHKQVWPRHGIMRDW